MSYALVIDDNRNTADALVEMLSMLGIEGRAAYGSSPAMALLKSISPPLILLDVNMPGVDGLEILAYLKREPRLSKSKVIVITSDDQPETRNRALNLGALALIVKPASMPQLEEVLKKAGLL